ncbi:MAG: hypothetical protein EAX81_03115 [Candidatus Thorarchaeota archaeon]|nr:hypothetical protein [Candidatus Thorarchaeota archaeon]
MKRSSVVRSIFVIGLLLVASVDVFFFVQPRLNQRFDFQWAVSINDKFAYSVIIRRVDIIYEYDSVNETLIYYESPLLIAAINNSVIVARILNLPRVPEEINRSSFGEFVRTDKVDCGFVIGTEISIESKR